MGLSTHVCIGNLDSKQLVGSTVVQLLCSILGPIYSSSCLFDSFRRCNPLGCNFAIIILTILLTIYFFLKVEYLHIDKITYPNLSSSKQVPTGTCVIRQERTIFYVGTVNCEAERKRRS